MRTLLATVVRGLRARALLSAGRCCSPRSRSARPCSARSSRSRSPTLPRDPPRRGAQRADRAVLALPARPPADRCRRPGATPCRRGREPGGQRTLQRPPDRAREPARRRARRRQGDADRQGRRLRPPRDRGTLPHEGRRGPMLAGDRDLTELPIGTGSRCPGWAASPSSGPTGCRTPRPTTGSSWPGSRASRPPRPAPPRCPTVRRRWSPCRPRSSGSRPRPGASGSTGGCWCRPTSSSPTCSRWTGPRARSGARGSRSTAAP